MIELKNMIGKGLHRECYVHPENDKLCVKVVVNGNDQETAREQAYYRRLLRKGVNFNSIPKFYGNIETTIGSGAVFDLIRDADGEVSKTLEFYLNSPEYVEQNRKSILLALANLKKDLLDEGVVTMTIHPKNIVCQIVESGTRLVIIDNIGSSVLIPLEYFFRVFANKKVERKWERFVKLLEEQFKFKV